MNDKSKIYTDGDFGTFDKRVKYCQTTKRNNCRDCGNPWWHDLPRSWVCTTCNKTHGKDTSEQSQWKPTEHLELLGSGTATQATDDMEEK